MFCGETRLISQPILSTSAKSNTLSWISILFTNDVKTRGCSLSTHSDTLKKDDDILTKDLQLKLVKELKDKIIDAH